MIITTFCLQHNGIRFKIQNLLQKLNDNFENLNYSGKNTVTVVTKGNHGNNTDLQGLQGLQISVFNYKRNCQNNIISL